MGFFKQGGQAVANKKVAQLQALIWVFIYGGLFVAVLGLSVQRLDDAIGWTMIVAGCAIATLGAVLIWVRSRINAET